jgi:spore germination protein YaaH
MRRTPAAVLALLLMAGWLPTSGARAVDPLSDGSVVTSDGRVLPPMPAELFQPSVHAEMLADHAADTIHFEPGAKPTILLDQYGEPQLAGSAVLEGGLTTESLNPESISTESLSADLSVAGLPNGLRKEVFGFLPYWMLTDSALSSMNYQLVSTVAYFSVNANKDGYLVKGSSSNPSTGWAGWTSSRMTQVIDHAHAEGVKVVLTVSMMAWDSASASRQAQLLGSSTARSRLANQIVNAVQNRGADGVNLDFEPLATSQRDRYTSFVKLLKQRLVNAGAGDFLTVCVMAGSATWASGYDVAGLTATGAANALFVMGYDYNWSGSSRAGGVAPIQSPYTVDVAGTMADFLTLTSGSKLIWGVPYYGRTWPTSSSALNAPTLGGGSKSYYYTGHLSQAQQYGRRWDDVGKVPWYRHWDAAAGNWVQGYYDDVQSLGAKYDLINARGLAGTGMWTLLMDQGRDELWHLLANKFVTDRAPPVGGISLLPRVSDAEAIRVRWRAEDFASGVKHYFVQWRQSGGSWHAWLSRTRATAAWFAGTAGRTYEFRIKAVDYKGNAQSWTTAPSRPASLKPKAFARVTASTLNIRSGPGTGYGIVDTAVSGDRVYVLEGPVSSGGYAWYRVQYGFSEWPSADYPRIAWMAGSASGDALMVPAQAPTVTKLSPFVAQKSRTALFSPNGDGAQDAAVIGYSLAEAATAARLDVLNATGAIVRTAALGARPSGLNSATWDGHVTGGAWAPAGRYLLRITATDSEGVAHSGPATAFSTVALNRWGIIADTTAPTVHGSPTIGAEMVPAVAKVVLTFSEPMVGIGGSSLQLYVGGTPLDAGVWARPDGLRAVLTPDDPLPTGIAVEVRLGDALRDKAGNQPATNGWTFMTAPGVAYDPSRLGRLAAGGRVGYRIAQDGDLLSVEHATLTSSRTVQFAQRATLPNLPGRWLYAVSGPLAGLWSRESAAQHLLGESSRSTFGTVQRVRLRPGTHVGYRFDSQGAVTSSRTVRLATRAIGASTVRAVINGVTYWRLSSGPLAGYWVAESATVYRRGFIGTLQFATAPRVDLLAGSYVGYRYDSVGRVLSTIKASVSHTTALHAAAWSVINGQPHFLVSGGTWAGTWLPETLATRLHV